MTKITIETETIETDLTPAEAAAKVKKALGVREFPQMNDEYWYIDTGGLMDFVHWCNTLTDRSRLAHGNCSPTQEGLAQYKADMAKLAAIVAIRKHRDKTFGVFEPDWSDSSQMKVFGTWDYGNKSWDVLHRWTEKTLGISIPFRKDGDIQRSFVECAEHWEVLK